MKTCQKCKSSFTISEVEEEFCQRNSPVFNEKKYLIPKSSLCSLCRLQKELAWRNCTKIYRRKCDLCKKDIISEYSPDKPHTIYCQKCYWSDKWSPLDYGRDFDFSRSFNEQFKELLEKAPLPALINTKTENSQYCHRIFNGKDNYYSFVALYEPEDLSYTYYTISCKHCLDIAVCSYVEWCYELVDCKNCYECFYSRRLNNCKNCYFSEDLVGCNHCFGCKNLVNQSYCIFNKKHSKEEYEKFVRDARLDQYSSVQKYKYESTNLFQTLPNKNIIATNCENCTGTYLGDCKDCIDCYNIYESKELIYCEGGEKSEDCYNCYGVGLGEHCSNSVTLQNAKDVHFCATVSDSNNLWYCYACYSNSSHSFGCVGLKHGLRCIFNKEYSSDDYEKQVAKIVDHMIKTGEWGQFFDSRISPFGYNETDAVMHFPLSKEEVLAQGFSWSDYESPAPEVEKVVDSKDLPEDTDSVTDKILNWAIRCEDSNRLFRLTAQELEFYRKYNIPIPRKHPDIRHANRIKLRLSVRSWQRKCSHCQKEIQANYPQDYLGKVYCQDCYNKEIYGAGAVKQEGRHP